MWAFCFRLSLASSYFPPPCLDVDSCLWFSGELVVFEVLFAERQEVCSLAYDCLHGGRDDVAR